MIAYMPGLPSPSAAALADPLTIDLPGAASAERTTVAYSCGDRKVTATVDARDESRLLQILDTARARAV